MASQSADPPAPQSEVVTTKGTNNTARIGAYTDTSITKRNSVETAAASDQPAKKTPENSQGDIRPVYANDKAHEKDNDDAATENASVDPPPHSPNKAAIETDSDGFSRSRDPYRNNGMVGQNFYRNGGS